MKKLLLLICLTFHSYAATVIPFERDVTRIPKPSFMSSRFSDSGSYFESYVGDENDNLYYQGFSFQNSGPNDVVTSTPQGIDFAGRDFSFVTDDRSRRDVYLWVTDYNGSGSNSDMMETLFVFLPRENQMHVEENDKQLIITLPTGEESIFSKEDKTILKGVLSEGALDLSSSRAERSFARLKYHGKGIVIRSDRRAGDPRLNKFLLVIKGNQESCRMSSDSFWTQEGYPQFKYISDEEAYAVIRRHCGEQFIP